VELQPHQHLFHLPGQADFVPVHLVVASCVGKARLSISTISRPLFLRIKRPPLGSLCIIQLC
jgi:hypothetical protein